MVVGGVDPGFRAPAVQPGVGSGIGNLAQQIAAIHVANRGQAITTPRPVLLGARTPKPAPPSGGISGPVPPGISPLGWPNVYPPGTIQNMTPTRLALIHALHF